MFKICYIGWGGAQYWFIDTDSMVKHHKVLISMSTMSLMQTNDVNKLLPF